MPEEVVIRPLTGAEVQEAVLYKIRESMARTCNLLATNAYVSFRAEIEIHLTLSDYGRPVPDNHHVVVEQVTGLPEPDVKHTKEVEIVIEPKPPNQVLFESEQDVDVSSTGEDGKRQIRKVRYTPRKPK